MKKYITIIAALLALSTGIPAYAETVEDTQYGVSFAEEISEQDPIATPEPNAAAPAVSEPSSSTEESGALSDLDTPMIFQRGEQGRGEVKDIIAYWEENGYPDNLSFIAETRSEMIDGEIYTTYDVGLVLATEEKRAEILDIAGNNNVLRFTDGATSLLERSLHFEKLCYLAAQEEGIGILEIRFYKNSDMIEVVVSGSEKTYYDRFGKQFGGVAVFVNERNTVTAVDSSGFIPGSSDNKVMNYIEKTSMSEIFHAADFLTAYPNGWTGNAPVITGGGIDGAIAEGGAGIGSSSLLEGTIGINAEASSEKIIPVWILFAVGAAVLILGAFSAVMLRMRVKAGADGTAAVRSSLKKEIVTAIKNAEEQPDPRLLEKIKDNIK